jgi:murein DD-endopeptidase MepM/ murein hydrolase activator NlpD
MHKKYLAEIIFLMAALFIFIGILNLRDPDQPVMDAETIPEPEMLPVPVLKFGLPVDSFVVSEGVVMKNQNLSHLLTNYGVSLGTIDQLARLIRDTFDVRKIKTGQKYYVLRSSDSLMVPEYFVYECSSTQYVVFTLKDSLYAYNGKKEVHAQIRKGAGRIETSLWDAMNEQNLSPVLALSMSDIYQWTIDFYGIQKGDQFRIIYEEEYVEELPVGIGKIHAIQFNHMGQDYFAFRFTQGDKPDYFDEEGKNLRKAFLKAPLRFSRISSRFSYSRMHPVLRYRRPHLGIDYAAPRGTPVQSIGDGMVTEKAYQQGGGGYYLKIKHNSVYTTTYMHLSGYAGGIAVGTRVKQGDVIGYVGSSGLATGPHLDFRISKNGHPVNPLKVEAPPGDSIRIENLNDYLLLKDSLMHELQQIEWEEVEK